MKRLTKKDLLYFGIAVLALAPLLVLAVRSAHFPRVATLDGGVLTYKGEPYIRIDERVAQELLGAKIEFGEVLGEIEYEFGLLDYILNSHPIQAVKGDDELNFIAQPLKKSPTVIYCKEAFYITINLSE